MRHGNIRCDVFDNVKIKPHRRGYQPNFKIYRHDDREPDRIKAQPLYDRQQQWRHHQDNGCRRDKTAQDQQQAERRLSALKLTSELYVVAFVGTLDERMVRVVECRFFAGYTDEETARALDVSTRTVQRDWKRARAWLKEEMGVTRRLGSMRR